MSATTIVIIVIGAIIIAALVIGAMAVMRRRRLKRRFGPEYDRVVEERQGQFKADSELADRERRVHGLDIRPLTAEARAGYSIQWTLLQERFVDAPQDAAAGAQLLIAAVMNDRGYPTEADDQIAADLSVEHADTLQHYRAAHLISDRAAAGEASTEDLRLAVIHYRALFDDLLGDPAEALGAAAAPDVTTAVNGAPVADPTDDANIDNSELIVNNADSVRDEEEIKT